jgi:hypothetical protein
MQNLQSNRVYKGSIVFSNLFDFEHYFEKIYIQLTLFIVDG